MEKRNATIKIIAIIAAIVLLLGATIGGAIWGLKLLFDDSAKDNNSDTSITSSETASTNNEANSSNGNEAGDNGGSSNGGSGQTSTSKGKTTTISIDDISTKKGKKISVPVKVSSNQGFMSAVVEVNYDTSALKYTGYKQGKLFSDFMFNNTDGKVKFIVLGNKDVKKDGVLVNLEFEVIAKSKTTKLDVNVEPNMIGNQKEEIIPVKLVDGSVKIK